jgi:Na+/proline symporter
MGIPVSLVVIAAGAILAFAVTGTSSEIDIQTVGWILMAAGFLGLVLSLVMWEGWAGSGLWREPRPGERAPRRARPR